MAKYLRRSFRRKKEVRFLGNVEHEEGECPLPRYRPDGIDALCKATGFSRKELQLMYRSFKQVLTHTLIKLNHTWHGSFPLVSTGAQLSLQQSNFISICFPLDISTRKRGQGEKPSAETHRFGFVTTFDTTTQIGFITSNYPISQKSQKDLLRTYVISERKRRSQPYTHH